MATDPKKKLDPLTYDVYGQNTLGGSGGGGSTGATPTPAPAVPRPSLAQQVGGVANTVLRLTRAMQPDRLAKTGMHAVAPVAEDVGYGFTNPGAAPRPAAPTPRPQSVAAVPSPVRNPAAPAAGGGGSTPAGGVSASPAAATATASVPAPRRARVNTGPTDIAYTTGDGRTGALPPGVAVVRTKDGTNAFGATGGSVAAATGQGSVPAVPRPALTAAPVMSAPALSAPNVANPSESSAVRDARNAAISEIGSQLFQLRGKTTRSARAATSDLVGQQAGLVSEAGRQAVDLAGGNRDAAARANIAALEQTGANQRTALQETGANQRANVQAETELARPTFTTDETGNYVAVDGTGGARVVTTPDGQPVRVPRPTTSLTPEQRLDFIAKDNETITQQLADLQQPGFQADPQAVATLQQRLARNNALAQSLLGGNPAADGALSAAPPAAAIADLRAGKGTPEQFDAIFGKGAAARYMTR